jgi:hypothetical protein
MMELLSGSDSVSFLWFSIASILPSLFLAHIGIHIYSLATLSTIPAFFNIRKYIYIYIHFVRADW